MRYVHRCSTERDTTTSELIAIVGVVLVLGAVAVLSSTWMGQDLLEYVARVFLSGTHR